MELSSKTPVHLGDPKIQILSINAGGTQYCKQSLIHINSHTGTHVDFPRHFIKNGKSKNQIPLETFIGKAVIVKVQGISKIEIKNVQKYETEIKECKRVIFCTNWNQKIGKQNYWEKNPEISKELAEWLIKKKIKLVGIDSFTVDNSPYTVHKILLKKGIVIVENLVNVNKIKQKVCEIIVAPLNLKCEDGAPARVFARVK